MFDFQDNLIKRLNVRITFHLDNRHIKSKKSQTDKIHLFFKETLYLLFGKSVKITCNIQVYKILYRFFTGYSRIFSSIPLIRLHTLSHWIQLLSTVQRLCKIYQQHFHAYNELSTMLHSRILEDHFYSERKTSREKWENLMKNLIFSLRVVYNCLQMSNWNMQNVLCTEVW